jgi:DNA gyrase subunit B
VFYAYTEEQKIKIAGKDIPLETEESIEEVPEEDEIEEVKGKRAAKMTIQRYKGLGEMNPEELWETTMDPARRILKQVTVEDGQDADRVFDILMGTDVESRKSFIQSHAKEATLDI